MEVISSKLHSLHPSYFHPFSLLSLTTTPLILFMEYRWLFCLASFTQKTLSQFSSSPLGSRSPFPFQVLLPLSILKHWCFCGIHHWLSPLFPLYTLMGNLCLHMLMTPESVCPEQMTLLSPRPTFPSVTSTWMFRCYMPKQESCFSPPNLLFLLAIPTSATGTATLPVAQARNWESFQNPLAIPPPHLISRQVQLISILLAPSTSLSSSTGPVQFSPLPWLLLFGYEFLTSAKTKTKKLTGLCLPLIHPLPQSLTHFFSVKDQIINILHFEAIGSLSQPDNSATVVQKQ